MLGIVFVHYRLPWLRLHDHLLWNGRYYDNANVCAWIVSDGSPPRVELEDLEKIKRRPWNSGKRSWSIVFFQESMPVFSLAVTKNYGIKYALEAGCDRIAATDVDVAWTEEALRQCAECGPDEAIVPFYQMALDYETRGEYSQRDKGCSGTVCMTAENWRRVRYDERYIGYGGEDGKLRKDISMLGIRERRDSIVYHIAHDPSKSQVNVPGAGRADCWNRDSINPNNWETNKLLASVR